MTPQANLSRLGVRSLTIPLAALLVYASAGFAQEAAPAAPATTTPAPAAPVATARTSEEEIVKMSPFEVTTDKNAGYYTANTLAGTRLNNNIGDVPSSITVVTQQQLQDTNSRNINDIFRYEVNTEGALTFTPIQIVRSNLADPLSGGGGTTGIYTSAVDTGNRVRGLSTVDLETDNFFTLYRIPFDAYNTQSVEILRGPNSIIFGTGSPSGIVNQERVQADTEKRSAGLSLSVSSYGGYRESFEVNAPLIPKRLGLYVAQLYDSQGFKQKPSSDITRRQYAAVTFYPFKSQVTKLTASAEHYDNFANLPNGVTPVDFVTPWIRSGRPVWNTVTDVVTYLDSGRTVGPYSQGSAYPNYTPATPTLVQANLTVSTSPYFVPSMTFLAANHRTQFIQDGTVQYTFNGAQGSSPGLNIPNWIPAVGSMTNAQKLVNEERLTLTTTLPHPAAYATWYDPGVSSKSVYDWSNINLASIGSTRTKANTFTVKLDQEILKNLHVQLAWFRQDLTQVQDQPLSQANATTVYVDTNQFLPDGTPNTHLGQPFVDVYASDLYIMPEKNDNYQAVIAYEPDLRPIVPNWLKWLGHHRFMAVFQQHDDVLTSLRLRPAIVGGDANYLPTTAAFTASTGYGYFNSNTAIEQWFYLGTPQQANQHGYGASSPGPVYHRPAFGGPTTADIQTYNYGTNSWATSQIVMDTNLYNTGGLSENLQRSATFFWQSFFWDDRIIGFLGVNQDKVKNRNTVFPATNPLATLYTNGYPNVQYWHTYGPWTPVVGTTHTAGVTVHPFKDWKALDAAADRGAPLAGVLRTLSFFYNKAGNFNPPTIAYTDYFGNPLGKPQGKETDYGLEIATPDNKLFLRATWFHTVNQNAITDKLTSNARALYIDQTLLKDWATKVVYVQAYNTSHYGAPPGDPNFASTTLYPITQAMQDQIAALTGLPYNFGAVGEQGQYIKPSTNQNGDAKGFELELTYNPIRNWTMKFGVGKQQTTVTGTAAQAQAWIDHRSPTWLTYAVTLPGANGSGNGIYTLNGGKTMSLNSFWNGYGYDTAADGPGNINGWTSTQAYYNVVVASQLAIDEANNGALAPNQREWTVRYLTNYNFDHGKLKGFGFGGAIRYDGRATAGYFGDTVHLDSAGHIAAPNIDRPIYTPEKFHVDLWASYAFKMPWVQGVNCRLQLNVADVSSKGYLLPVTFNFDGSPAGYRIVQPRTYTLSADFSF